MNFKIFIILVLTIFIFSCKDDDYQDSMNNLEDATILSMSTEECYCCAGYHIELNDETIFVDIDDFPTNEEVDAAIQTENFPIEVRMMTIPYDGDCPNETVAITEIELKNSIDTNTVKIFKYDGSIQCDYAGIPLNDMEQELFDAGITVVCSQKNSNGLNYTQVCGNATGRINVYLIYNYDLSIANELGFKSVDELSEYVDQPCEYINM